MLLQNDIETVVGLIEAEHIEQAVAMWSKRRGEKNCCAPCFYSPLDECVRCASCLDSNLSTALLQRAYAQVTPSRLEAARDSLSTWIDDRGLPQTG